MLSVLCLCLSFKSYGLNVIVTCSPKQQDIVVVDTSVTCVLAERSPSSVDVADIDGVTPFAAVFSNTESGMITLVE